MIQPIVTDNDFHRLFEMIEDLRIVADVKMNHCLDQLERALTRANKVDPKTVPAEVVTMNSKVHCTDLMTGAHFTCRITWPRDVDAFDTNVSVLAPIGMALLGAKVGDIINLQVPAGARRIRVEKILYQPEAAGDWEL